MSAKVEGVRISRTTADVRNPKALTVTAVMGLRLGIADRQEGKNKDGLGEQHVGGDRDEGGVVVVESNKTSAPGQMSNGEWWVR